MTRAAILLMVIAFVSCNQKEMTLNDLEKAKWDSVDMGIGHITIKNEKNIALKSDSIQFKLIGISGMTINPVDISSEALTGSLNNMLAKIIKTKMTHSEEGYLRINLADMLMRDLAIMVYLNSDVSDTSYLTYEMDGEKLKQMPGVNKIKFIGKDEAKKMYLKEGGEDWEKILSENPLPAAFELSLEKRKWKEEELADLKSLILEKVPAASTVTYPAYSFKNADQTYFFRYKLVKK